MYVYVCLIYLFVYIQYHSITCIQSIHSFVMFFSCSIIFAIFKNLQKLIGLRGGFDIFFHMLVMTLFLGKKFHVRWPLVVSLGCLGRSKSLLFADDDAAMGDTGGSGSATLFTRFLGRKFGTSKATH